MTAEITQKPANRSSFKEALLNKRMLVCAFTGFTSGLPLYIVIQLVPAWLRKEGVGLAEIGFFTLVQIPYLWKFLWSPIIDRYTLPFLGHRRGWMLLTQLALLISIAAMGYTDPNLSIWTVAYLAAAIAFFSASQDIVLDAYRRELLPDNELGIGNSIHIQTYRFAGLVPGSLALILADHLPWQMVFLIVALFMGVGIVFTFVIKEAISEPAPPQTLLAAVIRPFEEFIDRKGLQSAALILAFIFLYKLGDSMATALSQAFYQDIGFSLTQIGLIAKSASLFAAIFGGIVGGIIMIKLSINRALWLFGFVQITSILGFALLSVAGADPWVLGAVVAFEYLGVGLGTAAFTAYIARNTHISFAATQLALFTALASVPRVLLGATTGIIAESIGWTNFFFLCTVLAVPGMLLLFKVAPWNEDS